MAIEPRKPATRERLLASASRIFAAKGYRDTTVADICEAAQANIASVNYHFGNKESLYRQVWQRLTEMYQPPEPPHLPAGTEIPELRLQAHIVARLQWLIEDDPLERLVWSELAQPTRLVDDLRIAAMNKTQEHFMEAVRTLSGGCLPEPTVRLCVTSILSQCRALIRLSALGQLAASRRPTPDEIQAFAQHVAVFSIAGIKALMEREEHAAEFTLGAAPLASEPQPQPS